MLDLCNIVNTRPIYARKLSNFAVVPRKRDVGLNCISYRDLDLSRVVPRKRDVGLNVIENEIIPSDLESFLTRGTWV